MDSDQTENHDKGMKRLMSILLSIAIIISASGYFMGLVQTKNDIAAQKENKWEENKAIDPNRDSSSLPTAPHYTEQSDARWKANDDWEGHFARLHPQAVTRDPTNPSHPHEFEAAIAARLDRRAYDTAPPVVPHSIDEQDPRACLTCHAPGNARLIGDRLTPTISHPSFQNCTQCHVPASGQHELSQTPPSTIAVSSLENEFSGQQPIAHDEIAYENAPPVLPHPVWMRQNCLSCHGEGRPSAIRTSHPQRQNCLQCHAQNHVLDNREQIINQFPDFTPIPLPEAPESNPDQTAGSAHGEHE